MRTEETKKIKHKLIKEKGTKRWIHERESMRLRNFGMMGKA